VRWRLETAGREKQANKGCRKLDRGIAGKILDSVARDAVTIEEGVVKGE
jgi:hypothetical protein